MPKRYGLRWQNKKVRKVKSRKGTDAMLRNTKEAPIPDYPTEIDRSKDYRIIHIEDCMAGEITTSVMLLVPIKKSQGGRCDQFHVWMNLEHQGIMGWKKAYTLAGRQFVRMGAIS